MKKIFKNWKSKKELKEENIRLQTLLSMPVQIHSIERNIIPFKSCMVLEYNMPIEIAKVRIAQQLARTLLDRDLIEWDIDDEATPNGLATKVIGTVYIGRR